ISRRKRTTCPRIVDGIGRGKKASQTIPEGLTSMFTVEPPPRFERLARKLRKQHPEFIEFYREAVNVLELDPYNQTRQYVIKKLTGPQATDGQWRLSLRRWRFRYDIVGRTVELKICGLRRENTYR